MSKDKSCSACCGYLNLKKSDAEKELWLKENTQIFLNTDISRADNIVQYRKIRETGLSDVRIRNDIYVCPFLGFIDADHNRSGCLLHPKGSPHPQIHLWQHPQNFSFYGEGICLSYDCLNKERGQMQKRAVVARGIAYSRLAGNHNLWQVLNLLSAAHSPVRETPNVLLTHSPNFQLDKLLGIVMQYLEKYEIPVTSFEIVLKIPEYSAWDYLGLLLSKDFYQEKPAISPTQVHIRRGKAVRKLCST